MIRCRTDYNNSYIAGFFEGDGTAMVWMGKGRDGYLFFRPIIRFCNNDIAILKQIEKKLGKGVWHKQSYANLKQRPTYYLTYDSQKRARNAAVALSQEYLSTHRKEQLAPILKKLAIKPTYQRKPNLEWLKGFGAAEGWVCRSRQCVKGTIYSYFVVGLCQKNPQVLRKAKTLLRTMAIKGGLCQDKKNSAWSLMICRDSEKLMKNMEVLLA